MSSLFGSVGTDFAGRDDFLNKPEHLTRFAAACGGELYGDLQMLHYPAWSAAFPKGVTLGGENRHKISLPRY